jgi:hypothetical protein
MVAKNREDRLTKLVGLTTVPRLIVNRSCHEASELPEQGSYTSALTPALN